MSNASEQTIFVRNLIDAVREHRCLYDKKDSAYFNRREKEKAWHIIGQQLGRSDVACHRRWKLLREKFAKELKKRDRALKNGEPFQSDWTCFDNIMYIEEHIAPRKKNEKSPLAITKNLSTKRMAYEHTSSADTTTEKPSYCTTGLSFLAQLSKATLQAKSQLSDSQHSVSDHNSHLGAKLEIDESQADEMNSATTPTLPDSESSESFLSRSETPTRLHSTNAVDALLRELRSNKESNLHFVKNLTNALKINNLDKFKEIPQHQHHHQNHPHQQHHHLTFQQPSGSKLNDYSSVKSEVVTPIKEEVVRSTLLRVSGMNSLVNNIPNENFNSTEVTSSASLPTIDLKDEIFGKMVVTMLGDITEEECKDDAKFGIMQVLINAKRACKNKQFQN